MVSVCGTGGDEDVKIKSFRTRRAFSASDRPAAPPPAQRIDRNLLRRMGKVAFCSDTGIHVDRRLVRGRPPNGGLGKMDQSPRSQDVDGHTFNFTGRVNSMPRHAASLSAVAMVIPRSPAIHRVMIG